MSTISIPSSTLRDAKRLFSRLRHTRSKLPAITHLLVSADPQGTRLAATDLDHWLELQLSDDDMEPFSFLVPPAAMENACRADRGTLVSFTASGGRRTRQLGLSLIQGGIEVTSVHPTLDVLEFPARPAMEGDAFQAPPATLQSLATVAGCAARDATRQILNGVLFTPEDDGQLVATDGRRLACAPAAVPNHRFVLPSLAASILGHPGFTSDLATLTWIDSPEPETRRVAFQCGRHLLIAKTQVGNYPDFRQVIPREAREIAVIPHDRRPGVISWLRSLDGSASVRLDWHRRGQLTLTHRDGDGRSSSLQVPVEIHGHPPVIAFNASHLADALELGSTLCLSDEMSPGICRHPGGRFCVIVPQRVTIQAAGEAEDTPSIDHAA